MPLIKTDCWGESVYLLEYRPEVAACDPVNSLKEVSSHSRRKERADIQKRDRRVVVALRPRHSTMLRLSSCAKTMGSMKPCAENQGRPSVRALPNAHPEREEDLSRTDQ